MNTINYIFENSSLEITFEPVLDELGKNETIEITSATWMTEYGGTEVAEVILALEYLGIEMDKIYDDCFKELEKPKSLFEQEIDNLMIQSKLEEMK